MIENKNKFATKLYEIFDDLMVEEDGKSVSIDKLLTPAQKYSVIMNIIKDFPLTNLEMVTKFQEKFKIPRETTHIVSEFQYGKLRFDLLLEEVLELGIALDFSDHELYHRFATIYRKVTDNPSKPGITSVLDALTDILFVAYGGFHTFNLEGVQYEAMEEVYTSNMSKLIPVTGEELTVVKESRDALYKKGVETVTNDLKNGYLSITSMKTGKIQKPVTYIQPNLQTIINNHFKNK